MRTKQILVLHKVLILRTYSAWGSSHNKLLNERNTNLNINFKQANHSESINKNSYKLTNNSNVNLIKRLPIVPKDKYLS